MTSSLKSNVKTKVLEKLIEVKFLSWVSAFSVFISCFFVLWVLNPDGALFTLSTPTGGAVSYTHLTLPTTPYV